MQLRECDRYFLTQDISLQGSDVNDFDFSLSNADERSAKFDFDGIS